MPAQNEYLPSSPSEIEAQIAQRRASLSSTIDQLAARTKPQALAQRAVDDVKTSVDSVMRTPDGQLRTDKVAAIGAATAAVLALMIANRRRRRRRRAQRG